MTSETIAKLRPVRDVAEEQTGRRPSPPCQHRWIHVGCRGIKLHAVYLHGKWLCSVEDFLAFLEARSADRLSRGKSAAQEPTERDEATAKRLQGAGLL